MDTLLTDIQKFGSLINITILLAIFLYLTKIFKSIIKGKDTTIELMREQLGTAKEFSVENVTEKFRSLKEYYECHLKKWYENSVEQLEAEKQRAIESKTKELEDRINEEINKRTLLKDKYRYLPNSSRIVNDTFTPEDVCGTYAISGHNPSQSWKSYYGNMEIKKVNQIYEITWNIESGRPSQVFNGKGILLDNVISFVFQETTEDRTQWNGLISYEVISPEIMRGTWVSLTSQSCGSEEARRITRNELEKNVNLYV